MTFSVSAFGGSGLYLLAASTPGKTGVVMGVMVDCLSV